MDCCNSSCLQRYSSNENFRAPESIWQTPEKWKGSKRTMIIEGSISMYLLNVIGNVHNKIMANDYCKSIKLVPLVALEVLTVGVTAFALVETIASLAFLVIVGLVDVIQDYRLQKLDNSICMLFRTGFTLLQIPNGFKTMHSLLTAEKNMSAFRSTPFIGS